jgi:hypothetical protein
MCFLLRKKQLKIIMILTFLVQKSQSIPPFQKKADPVAHLCKPSEPNIAAPSAAEGPPFKDIGI